MNTQLLSIENGVIDTISRKNYRGKPVTETLTNGFFTVDNKWTVKYWNKAAEKLLGVTQKDIIGKNLWQKFASVIPLEFYAAYQKAFKQDAPVHFQEYWGEMGAWFDVTTYFSDDILSVSFKSSNHPHAEYPESPVAQLKTLTELYRFVTEITNDCLWEWHLLKKEIFWIDGGHKRIFGYPIENILLPQSFWENSIHPDDKVRVLTRLNKILTEASSCLWEEDYRFQKADGDYAFVHDRAHIIYDEGNVASRMIGATRDITETVLLQKKMEEERRTKQKEITNAVLEALEKERGKIGAEMHDDLNQMLAVTRMYMEMAKKAETKSQKYLDTAYGYIGEVITKIRNIARDLVVHPSNIVALFGNIKNLIADFKKVHPLKITFTHSGIDEEQIDAKLQVTIFRIVQEQFNNIIKHSAATNASINLSKKENEMLLVISDNGQGCVRILSKPGEGYELRVVLPFDYSK